MSRFSIMYGTVVCLLLHGCTFAHVRSAQVNPGTTVHVQASLSSDPGPDAGWFWAFGDCYRCSSPIPALDVGVSYGIAGSDGHRPRAWEAGLDGFSGYAGGYVQLFQGERSAYGVGGRFGIPWPAPISHSMLYGRYDRLLPNGDRLLWNPALLVHAGNSPNGANPAAFVGLVQSAGLEMRGKYITVIPSVSLVLGGGYGRSYGQPRGPFRATFGTAAVSVSAHGRRPGAR